uniref:Uncharacterized protein n=1 Tax=Anguilla anguilla TaxID=7936 RepID=A0A0E9UM59_ANGAN
MHSAPLFRERENRYEQSTLAGCEKRFREGM